MMKKTTKIRKRIFALCLALTAFLAMPLTAGAAYSSTTGTLEDYGVCGSLWDYALYAQAFTECQEIMATTTVRIDLYFTYGKDIKSTSAIGCNFKATSTKAYVTDYRYTVYKTISDHCVMLGKDYKWQAGIVSYYNGN